MELMLCLQFDLECFPLHIKHSNTIYEQKKNKKNTISIKDKYLRETKLFSVCH